MTIDFGAYDAFLADAERDNRIGDHEAVVISIKNDAWPSGQGRTKVVFQLLTANNAKADITLSEVPDAKTLEAEKDTMEKRVAQGIAMNLRTLKALAQNYGKTRETIAEGDVFRVHTSKNKEGFIRVDKFLPKDAKAAAKSGSDVPF